jgi:hypothetical protein
MATRSTISVILANGSVKSVYCHWDGYPEWVGVRLKTFFCSQEKAEAIIALGSISSLGESIECPEGHSFDTPVKGFTVFYGRDRDESNTEATEYSSVETFLTTADFQEYNYIFHENDWKLIDTRLKVVSAPRQLCAF